MIARKPTLWLALPCLALAACSETAFQDTLGIGKSAPDETKVRTVQPLSVPPDLELRPPAEAATNAGATAPSASTGRTAFATPPVDGVPAAGGGAAAGQAPAGEPKTDSAFYDIYRKHGISLYHADGTRKKIVELNRELAEKLKEEKRRRNPNYGTIFNMGSIWK